MSNPTSRSFILLLLIFISALLQAQKLQRTDIPIALSPAAEKKGMYVTSTLNKDGNFIQTFVAYDTKKDELGFDVATVDLNGKLNGVVSEKASPETALRYGITIPPPNTVKNPAQGLKIVRLVTSNGVLGKLKVEEGNFEPKYRTDVDAGTYVITYTPVLRGFKFNPTSSVESEMRLNIFAAHTDPGSDIERSYTILEGLIPNTIGYYDLNAAISFIGKDSRFDKNSPNFQNVLISGRFDGKSKSFVDTKELVLDYNLTKVADGFDGKGNRAVLVSTVNAPTTIGAHKKFNAGGRQVMTYVTFDTRGNVMENVTFESASVKGNFGIYGAKDATYIIGSINGNHDGYYMPMVGKPTLFQIVKIQNNKVTAQVKTTLEELQSMVVTPEGKKAKLDYGDLAFWKFQETGTGDHLVFTQYPGGMVIFQFNPDAKINGVYSIGRVEGKELFQTGITTANSESGMWLLLTEQSVGIALGLKMSVGRYEGGLQRDVNFSRVDEIMNFGKIVKLDPVGHTLSESIDINEQVILGADPMFLGAKGELLLPVRDMRGKKNYSIVTIK